MTTFASAPSASLRSGTLTARRRGPVIGVLVGLLILLATACGPPAARSSSWPQTAEMLQLVNAYRAQNHSPALVRTAELDRKAQAHTEAVAAAGRLYHSDLAAGISSGWQMLGENVAYDGDVAAAQQGLQGSPPHRANLLNPAFNHIGIGVVQVNGTTWVTQVFEQR